VEDGLLEMLDKVLVDIVFYRGDMLHRIIASQRRRERLSKPSLALVVAVEIGSCLVTSWSHESTAERFHIFLGRDSTYVGAWLVALDPTWDRWGWNTAPKAFIACACRFADGRERSSGAASSRTTVPSSAKTTSDSAKTKDQFAPIDAEARTNTNTNPM